MSINLVMVTGNLTRDAELRNTNTNGTPVLNFSVAVNDRRRNNTTGEWEDYPNYFDCSLFGTRAEKIAQYLTKGRRVAIEGKLRWSQWEKNGEKRNSVSILVDEIEFMNRPQGESNGGNNGGGNYDAPAQNDYAGADDDMPF